MSEPAHAPERPILGGFGQIKGYDYFGGRNPSALALRTDVEPGLDTDVARKEAIRRWTRMTAPHDGPEDPPVFYVLAGLSAWREPITIITSECYFSPGCGLQMIGGFERIEDAKTGAEIDRGWRRAGLPYTTVEVAFALGLDSVAELANAPLADLLPHLATDTETAA